MHSHSHSHSHDGEMCCGHGQDSGEDEERLEREALGRVVLAFRRYQEDADREVDRWEHNLRRLPPHQQALIGPSQKIKYATARQCIYNNHFFIRSMLSAFDPEAGGDSAPAMLSGANAAADDPALQTQGLPGDTEKVRYVLKNLVRDWSVEGAAEREASYGRIVSELNRLFKDWDPKSEVRPRVLLPGAGLARLCCEVAGQGYEAQGNEFAYFMLITSSFVLNTLGERDQYTIFPWVTSTCNVRHDADQLRGVTIPDVCPLEIVSRTPHSGLLSMAAGDFVEVYSSPSQAGAWDCVATCFFIDTAHNVLQYLEVLSHCIKPGGFWINLGPLLYHWADGFGMSELSVELSLSEIRRAAEALGFTMLREEEVVAPYIANIRSMFQTEYKAVFWTMQKTSEAKPAAVPDQPPPPNSQPPPPNSQPPRSGPQPPARDSQPPTQASGTNGTRGSEGNVPGAAAPGDSSGAQGSGEQQQPQQQGQSGGPASSTGKQQQQQQKAAQQPQQQQQNKKQPLPTQKQQQGKAQQPQQKREKQPQ